MNAVNRHKTSADNPSLAGARVEKRFACDQEPAYKPTDKQQTITPIITHHPTTGGTHDRP